MNRATCQVTPSPVIAGVDGSASNDCGNMLAEARLACLLQRSGGDPQGKFQCTRQKHKRHSILWHLW